VSTASARVMARADELATCSERPGEITRRYGTAALVAARDLLEGWMQDAGMTTRVDRVGNLTGTLAEDEPRPGIMIGSHFDTVIDAGRYDGTLGILLGIACAEELRGAERAHDLTVVAFCDEEGVRFPTAYFGSRAFVATRPEPDPALTDTDGATLGSALAIAGNAEAPPASSLPSGAAAYIEPHIEQGLVLDSAGAPLGIVTAINGGAKLAVTLTGAAGHAGTVPMHLRHDPFSAAAEIALEVERLARADPEAVATIGQVAVAPGAANVIPGQVTMSIDARHSDDGHRAGLLAGIRSVVAAVAAWRPPSRWCTTSAPSRATPTSRAACAGQPSRSASTRPRSRAAPATTRRCLPTTSRWRCCSYAAATGSATTRPSPSRPRTWPPRSRC
jgi:allantoate deiminase